MRPGTARARPAGAAKKELHYESGANYTRELTSLTRISGHRFFAQGSWEVERRERCDDCGYRPYSGTFYDTYTTVTEYCSVDIIVVLVQALAKRAQIVDGRRCF